eukprot:CAMPEP_0114577680 /NCGR_PEP_ID=MMETSP0125-20121206/2322_1 /TAXON_ID=485358 ORGANISM="Aristerostoma sp., Strain ATCC 50986" /NCGR_SAMPLE_ID=MMETSP0125 /ASSEMBLY_ACC=CAM_ASM_000245 /LENGTH=150 /DNA_ID=CAMNT_0001767197 /DNA_START=632 /DNA_END=1084 /DNA_ORIENTATION=+
MWKVVSVHARARPRLLKFCQDFKYNRTRKVTFKGPPKKRERLVEVTEDADNYLQNFANNDERVMYGIWRCYGEKIEIEEKYEDSRDKKLKVRKTYESLPYQDRVDILAQTVKLKPKNPYLLEMANLYKTYLSNEKPEEEKPIIECLKDRI